jgi:hypothetical protein
MNQYHIDFIMPVTISFDDADVIDFFNIAKEEINNSYREKYLISQIEQYAEDEFIKYSDYNYYRIENKKKEQKVCKIIEMPKK